MTWTDITFKLKCLIFGKTTAKSMRYIDEAYDRAFSKKKNPSKELNSILRSMLDSKERLIKKTHKTQIIHKKWHLCKRCHDVTVPLEDFHCDKCYRIVLARWLS